MRVFFLDRPLLTQKYWTSIEQSSMYFIKGLKVIMHSVNVTWQDSLTFITFNEYIYNTKYSYTNLD